MTARREGRTGRPRGLFTDERGLTTTGMVLALLVSLSLVFSSAQVYRVNSLSAEVQDVADAAALAAEGQVGEFMIIARFCDAVSLTLSLTGVSAVGIGVVALCVPPTAPLGKALVDAGQRILQSRDAFADRACDVLNALQRALPYYAAACAAHVAVQNDGTSEGSRYTGAAVLVPFEAHDVAVKGSPASSRLADDAEDNANRIADEARRAEEASERCQEAKERGFARDCGDDPSYCMRERASTLAGLTGSENPRFTSVDAWSFSVALERARSYYAKRAGAEAPASGSVDEQSRSALRAVFYEYASKRLDDGYVRDDGDSFAAYFPRLPKNTDEMRRSSLYTEALFPRSQTGEGEYVLHAWPGCPDCTDRAGSGSLEQAETERYPVCPTCGFDAASMGSVAAASTAIENGFEYHYDTVAQAADDYARARAEADEAKNAVSERVDGLFNVLKEALGECAGKRIAPKPPGHDGAVALIVNAAEQLPSTGLENSFATASGFLGPRAAVAGATLVEESSDDDDSVLTALLDNVRPDGGAGVKAADTVLDLWSGFLTSYAEGQKSLEDAIEKTLNRIPTQSKSGLGTRAAKKLKKAIKDVNLEPAKLGSLKPALVNSGHVAQRAENDFARDYMQVKVQVASHPLASTDLFSALVDDVHAQADDRIDAMRDRIDIATIDILGTGDATVTVSVPLPKGVKPRFHDLVGDAFADLRNYHIETTGVRPWE